MIEAPFKFRSHDRLTAFLNAFGLTAESCQRDGGQSPAHLFVLGDAQGQVREIRLYIRGECLESEAELARAQIHFGDGMNPLVGALPTELVIDVRASASLAGLAELLVAEAVASRCGGGAVRNRLCEVIVVLMARQAIAMGTVSGGLLAGLAHPQLHTSLIAMHDQPDYPWRVDELAKMTGLSRSGFAQTFTAVVGQTPGAYHTGWRLALGRHYLASGRRVKQVAAMVGFGSQEAFSRAFSRVYGCPPSAVESY